MPFSLKNQGRGQRQYRSRAHSLTGRSGLRRHTCEEKMGAEMGQPRLASSATSKSVSR